MAKPRVIIADENAEYIIPLQLKFVREFFNQINLEIVTDREYFEELFAKPQEAGILIISEELYNSSLQRHNIANIFVMTEEKEDGGTEELNINKIEKYTDVKSIFNEIVGKSAAVLNVGKQENKETQIVLVTSAAGGTGKTTLAMGVAAQLSQNYKKVLYINAGHLQCFSHMLDNSTYISSPEVYARLANPTEQVYSDIRHVLRKEIFTYLPPFKAALLSLGLKFSVYEKIAVSAKQSKEYDFIVIDAESTFDEDKTRLLNIADKVIIVTEQSKNAVEATNGLISNISGVSQDKYIFVCNKFDKDSYNALIAPEIAKRFTVNEHVNYFEMNGRVKCEELSKNSGFGKVSYFVI